MGVENNNWCGIEDSFYNLSNINNTCWSLPGVGVGIFDTCINIYGLPAGSNGWGK